MRKRKRDVIVKNNRLFGIVYLLLSKESVTANELADYFEVSTRTIYRDIETLSELNIPIYMSKGKNGGISLLDNYKLDRVLLTDEEQNQILFSLQGINKLQIDKNNTYEKMKSIFLKDDENWFDVDFSVWGKSLEHQRNFETIKKAIIDKKVLEFSYFSSYGNKTVRLVEPLKLCFKHNAWYLCAFDRDKDDYRLFKIMRIKDLKASSETFERTMKEMEEEPIETVRLVLEIDKKIAYRVYDEFDEQSIQTTADGNFIVTVEFPFNDWLIGYILSFGTYAKVLEPSVIKEEIIERLKKSLDNYS